MCGCVSYPEIFSLVQVESLFRRGIKENIQVNWPNRKAKLTFLKLIYITHILSKNILL